MKCYNLEEITAFAMNPASVENIEIACHIAKCKECRQDFELALETLSANSDPLPGDEKLAKEATQALFAQKNSWKRFQNFIAKAAEKLKQSMTFMTTEQFAKPGTQMAFCATGTQANSFAAPKFNSLPTITFESEAPNHSDYYWKVQMALPMMLSNSAMISMKVSDKTGSNLKNGTLLFLNKEFPILFGTATIPFKDFQENRQCASIEVRFSDGRSTAGSIKFLPESF